MKVWKFLFFCLLALGIFAVPTSSVSAQSELPLCLSDDGKVLEEACVEYEDLAAPPWDYEGEANETILLVPYHGFTMPESWRCQNVFTFWESGQTDYSIVEFTQPQAIISYEEIYGTGLNDAILGMDADGISLGEGDILHARVTGDAWWEETSPQARAILATWLYNGAVIAVETEFAGFGSYSPEPNELIEALGGSFRKRMTEEYVAEPDSQWWVGPVGASSRSDKWFSSEARIGTFMRGEFYATAGFSGMDTSRALYYSTTSRTTVMVEEEIGAGILRVTGDTSSHNRNNVNWKESVAQQWAVFMSCEAHPEVPTTVGLQTFESKTTGVPSWSIFVFLLLVSITGLVIIRK